MLDRVVASLKRAHRFGSSACVDAARARAACEVARLHSYRIVDQRRHGIPPGPEGSAARFATVTCERLVAEFVGFSLALRTEHIQRLRRDARQ